jgi:hypothetical protein
MRYFDAIDLAAVIETSKIASEKMIGGTVDRVLIQVKSHLPGRPLN